MIFYFHKEYILIALSVKHGQFYFLKVLEQSEDGKMCSGLQGFSAFQCGYFFLEVASCPHLGLTTPHN